MHALTQAAFAEYVGILDPPSGALRESVETVREDLAANGGAIAWLDREPVGSVFESACRTTRPFTRRSDTR